MSSTHSVEVRVWRGSTRVITYTKCPTCGGRGRWIGGEAGRRSWCRCQACRGTGVALDAAGWARVGDHLDTVTSDDIEVCHDDDDVLLAVSRMHPYEREWTQDGGLSVWICW